LLAETAEEGEKAYLRIAPLVILPTQEAYGAIELPSGDENIVAGRAGS